MKSKIAENARRNNELCIVNKAMNSPKRIMYDYIRGIQR